MKEEGNARRQLHRQRVAAIRNREIGFIFQTFYLISERAVLDNVHVPLLYRRMGGGGRRRLARGI